MEAASTIANLNTEETEAKPTKPEESSEPKEETPKPAKRFIPDHKKPDAALTFPEKVSLIDFLGICCKHTCCCEGISYLPATLLEAYEPHEVCGQAEERK